MTDVLANESRRMLEAAYEHGAANPDIAKLCNVSKATIGRIRNGEKLTIPQDLARDIVWACKIWIEMHPDCSRPVDIDPDRKRALAERIRQLTEIGYDGRQIGDLAGVGKRLITDLASGRCGRTITHEAASAIEAIPIDIRRKIATTAGATRRLRALVSWGYTCEHLASEAQLPPIAIQALLDGEDGPLGNDVAIRISQTFARLEQTPGPSDLARSTGRHNGWPVPFQYDEYTIDNVRPTIGPARRGRARGMDEDRRLEVLSQEFSELAELLAAA